MNDRPYVLRNCFRTYRAAQRMGRRFPKEHTMVFPIWNSCWSFGVHVHHNMRIEISPAMVVLEMRGDTGRYHTRARNQRIGQSDFDKLTQTQHHFHTIDSRWNENDEEEQLWLFRKMKMFDQNCTPQTKRHVIRAIDRWKTRVATTV